MVACSVWKCMLCLIDVAYGPKMITGNVIWMDVRVDKPNYAREKISFKLGDRKLRAYHIQAQIG